MTGFIRSVPSSLLTGLLLTTAALALGSCGDGATAPDGGGGAGGESGLVTCDWVSLAEGSAMPTARVELGAVPDSFAVVSWVEVQSPSDTTTGYTWFEVDDAGTASMVTPVHPLGDPDGGDVELTVTDGTHTCAPVDFTIEALPEAPGTFAALVDSLAAALDVEAAIAGTTAEALQTASFDTLDNELLPLALAQAVVSHPDNPNSMSRLAAGTSEVLGDADLTLANRLLARTGAPASVNEFLATVRERAAVVPTAAIGAVPLNVQGAGEPAAAYDCGGITSAFELDWCMARARIAINALQGATGRVLQDAGLAFGAASLVPPAKAAASAVGSVIYAADLYFDAASHLLPSELSDLTVELTRSSFKEDEDSTGTWHNSKISAKSSGWNLDQRIVKTMLEKGGVSDAFGGVATAAANLTGTGLGEVVGFLVSDRITNAITAKAGDPNGIIQIPAQTFGPVNVDAEEWTDSHVDASGVLAMTSRTVYEPRHTGVGEVVVETREGKFGGQQREAREPVQVGLITIGIDPTSAQVDPGASRSFDVTVHNAVHPERLQVTAEHGSVTSVTYQGDGLHKVSYTAPSQTSFHDFITAVDTATTGTLEYSGRQPLAQADITSNVELLVDPLMACIDEVGQDTTFTATVVGLEDQTVTWTVKQGPGTVDDNGTYTATDPGSAVLEVTAVADTTLKAQVQVTVGGCSCWWAVNITGAPPFGSGIMDEAWTLSYAESGGQLTNITLSGDAVAGASATFSVGSQSATGVALAPGIYDVSGFGSYVNQSTITHQFLSTDSLPPLTLHLVEADSAHVRGDISGSILVDTQPIADGNYTVGNVQATFKITPNATQDTGYGTSINRCEWPW